MTMNRVGKNGENQAENRISNTKKERETWKPKTKTYRVQERAT